IAADVANAVVDEYQRLSAQRRLNSTAGARQFLEQQIDEAQARLETSEKELTELARTHRIVDLEDTDNILHERLRDLSNQLTAVVDEYQRLSAQRRLNSTAGARQFLEQQIDEVQARLETSEKELTEFARTHRIVDLEDTDNILNERLGELSTQLTEVQNQRIQAETL